MNLRFEQYLNVRWAGGATFRGDGDRMAFRTDITGTGQLWTLDGAQQWPEQLTFYDDRLMFTAYSPTEPVIAFGKDAGGDEDQLIYLISDEGGAPQRLSVKNAKHMWGAWSPDGQSLAWSHNGRNGRDFDVYVYDLGTGEERRVVEGEGYWVVSRWMPDGSGVLVNRMDSNTNSDLFLVELGTSEPRLLTPHEGDAFYYSPCPTPDGKALWLSTNVQGEFMDLARIDLETLEITFPDPEQHWDVDELELSDDGRWLVVVRNEGGYSQITVRDMETSESHRIEGLPDGTVGGVRFIRDTMRFSVTCSPTADSVDVWVVDARTGECERWTRSAMAGIPRSSLREPELVQFDSFDGLEIPGFFWRPDADPPYPVLIDIHGGPESQHRPNFRATTQYFVQRGLAVFAPNVRGSRGYGKTYMSLDDVRKRMHSVADIKACRNWLVEHGDADPDRIAVKGGSYGGFMVLSSMVTYPDLWAAGVDIVGIANFVTFLENTSDYRRHLREPEYGSLETDREFLHDISPLTHIDQINAPLMVIHGANDPRVPVGEAEQVVEACREKGLPVRSLIYDDEGHGLAKRNNRLDAYPQMLDFLIEHLGL